MENNASELGECAKIDLGRRMDIAGACVAGVATTMPGLVEAIGRLAEFKKSKLIPIAMGVGLVSIFAGQYVADFFYGIAFVSGAVLAGRYYETYSQEAIRDRRFARIANMRVLWLTGGHNQSDFDNLKEMARTSDAGGLDSDTKEYGHWWHEVRESALLRY